MLSIIRADGTVEQQALMQLRSRSGEVDREVTAVVTKIIADVRQDKDEALKRYAQKFDGAAPQKLEVSREEIQKALLAADDDFVRALRRAKENIAAFHERQKQQSFWMPSPTA